LLVNPAISYGLVTEHFPELSNTCIQTDPGQSPGPVHKRAPKVPDRYEISRGYDFGAFFVQKIVPGIGYFGR
jgi:hypothetical protein